ncbi:hypothetical protein BX616_003858 [Lobosporangium transversale]|nr:hypothetical protein BX616_003858 [Lobosporangium transversale]
MATLTKSFDKLGSTSIRTSVPFPWLSPEQSHQYGRNFLHFTPQSLEPPLPVLFSRPSTPSISSDQQLRLLNAYFDHFNVFLPIIHRHQFMKQWQRQFCPLCSPSIHSRSQSPTRTKQLKQQQQQPSPQEVEAHKEHLLNPVIPLSPLLLNALLAVASKVPIVNHSEGSPTASMHSQEFFDAARLLLDDFLDVPRVSTVQALTLMSQFHHQNQWKITRSNSYLATAIRMAHELGLNRDPEMLCGAEADALRCLWWSLFILDHQFSAWLGLSLLIQGKESNVELPMDFSSSPVELRGFVCMVRLVKILSSVLQHSYSTQSLPPQFGGHDSMVSYIEGSLTSWLSNLAPDLRWHYPNGVGARKSPLNPQQQQAIVVGVKHATALAKDYSEIYPAYLYIMYNMTLILLHRPYIVGAAGSPAAAQSNTICTGSGRAITDIAQGLDIMHCSYVVNRYALYALLQAGVIHAMNAVYDRRGSNVAMDYYKRTLHILGNFLTCTEYAGGVAEGIKILEQFLATTSKNAAEDELKEGGTGDLESSMIEQDESQSSRKRKQMDASALHESVQNMVKPIPYQPQLQSQPQQQPHLQPQQQPTVCSMSTATSNGFVQSPLLTTTTLSMMASPKPIAVIGSQPPYMYSLNQSTPAMDLKEQQKLQQLKIQQQHRMYQQMQTFGGGPIKTELNKEIDSKKLEQQQQQQQQLLRQQLQRQQQRQQLELEMKDQENKNGSINPASLQSPSPSVATPVIPSHRFALQMLQQQQHQHQHQALQQAPLIPMTMSLTTMAMGAEGKTMDQSFQLSNAINCSTPTTSNSINSNGMITPSSTTSLGVGYGTQFWMDFSTADPSASLSAGIVNPGGLNQGSLRVANTTEGQNQHEGSTSQSWM